VQAYEQSELKNNADEVDKALEDNNLTFERAQQTTSWCEQYFLLAKRNLAKEFRTKSTSYEKLFIIIALSLISIAIFNGADGTLAGI